jgi:hypothetical protein
MKPSKVRRPLTTFTKPELAELLTIKTLILAEDISKQLDHWEDTSENI